MSRYIAAIDQGTTSTRCIIFDQPRRHRRARAAGTPSAHPAPGLGRARSGRNLAPTRSPWLAPRWPGPGSRRRPRRRRPQQPARDDRAVGPPHRPPARQRDRMDGYAHRRAGAPLCGRRRPGPVPRAHRPAARRPISPGSSSPGCSMRCPARGGGGARGSAVRHRRFLARLVPHRRPGRRTARDRRHQREPHPAHGPRDLRVGPGDAGAVRHSRPRACRVSFRSSAVLGKITLAPLRGVRSGGTLGDQQAALVGQTCFAPGEAKNTYGTGASC